MRGDWRLIPGHGSESCTAPWSVSGCSGIPGAGPGPADLKHLRRLWPVLFTASLGRGLRSGSYTWGCGHCVFSCHIHGGEKTTFTGEGHIHWQTRLRGDGLGPPARQPSWVSPWCAHVLGWGDPGSSLDPPDARGGLSTPSRRLAVPGPASFRGGGGSWPPGDCRSGLRCVRLPSAHPPLPAVSPWTREPSPAHRGGTGGGAPAPSLCAPPSRWPQGPGDPRCRGTSCELCSRDGGVALQGPRPDCGPGSASFMVVTTTQSLENDFWTMCRF